MQVNSIDIPDFSKGVEPYNLYSSGICIHPKHELYYMIDGITNYMIGGKHYTLKSGEMIFIPKNTMHSMSTRADMDYRRLRLSFDDNIIPENFKQYIQYWSLYNLIYIPPKYMSEIEKIFRIIETEYKNQKPHYEQFYNLCILQLLLLLDRYHSKPPQSTIDETNTLINNIAGYIQTNFHNDINLDFLCKTFSISKSYLSRSFKNICGIGISDYITYIRMLHAEQLLRTTDLPIGVIAEKCGYDDSNYFSTVFKKYKGMTARQFRND